MPRYGTVIGRSRPQKGRQAGTQTDKERDRQRNRQTGRETGRQAEKTGRQADEQAGRQRNRQAGRAVLFLTNNDEHEVGGSQKTTDPVKGGGVEKQTGPDRDAAVVGEVEVGRGQIITDRPQADLVERRLQHTMTWLYWSSTHSDLVKLVVVKKQTLG